ncbi:MAG: deoxyguanosinetriphosphate triphosphohydrolase [Thermoleophilia bacterium]|jgi:dGTPase|nr:deoxyguanosinetriphosphate triphosphohydrolase [Thermoleophilia bacterium]
MREPPLDPRAARAADAMRDVPEDPCPLRTAFQRDRDRIIHTKAFRRLKHKTQVFISPEGDHYRTRLTHTLEVSAIGRTVARAMGLNEDLVEAITMGHDLGHAPFGHAGEHALDDFLRDSQGRRFQHNEQSVRVVEVLERDGRGLNLTQEVRDGIRHHTGSGRPATLEGQIVRLVDRIAYVNHDIDDAIRAGIISGADLPGGEIAVLGRSTSERITTLVTDIVTNSSDRDEICQSDEVGEAFRSLRAHMFREVYLAPPAADEAHRARGVVQALVSAYLDDPGLLPAGGDDDVVTRVTDFVSGMTDRYALRAYRDLFIPHEGPL